GPWPRPVASGRSGRTAPTGRGRAAAARAAAPGWVPVAGVAVSRDGPPGRRHGGVAHLLLAHLEVEVAARRRDPEHAEVAGRQIVVGQPFERVVARAMVDVVASVIALRHGTWLG